VWNYGLGSLLIKTPFMKYPENCLIYNYAQHYRLGVFKELDATNDFHFYFGDKYRDVKKINYKHLSGFVKEFRNIKIFKEVYFQFNSLETLFRPYNNYIILGEYFCISTWIILLSLKIFKGKKVYLWTHGYYGNESKLKYFVKDLFFSLADGVFLYGNHSREIMIKRKFNNQRLNVIYNSLNYKKSKSLRSQLVEKKIFYNYFKNLNPTILFIGRLTKVKKLDMLLNVVHQLGENSININLFIFGEGEIESSLRALSVKLDIVSNVFFYGACYDEEIIAQHIYNSDIVVSPGNVGLTAIHSMSYGAPVITHSNMKNQMPESESIIPGFSGDYFTEDDEIDLMSVIKNWLNFSKKNRKTIRENCFQQIDSKFNPLYQKEIILKALK